MNTTVIVVACFAMITIVAVTKLLVEYAEDAGH